MSGRQQAAAAKPGEAGEPIFALDIGTRVVVGVVVDRVADTWRIRAAAVEEHAQRSMFDGQIHDIPAVAAVVGRIKEKLEKKLKLGLREVAVAAAGRALRTQRARAGQRVPPGQGVSREAVLALELEAVQEALRLLARRDAAWHEYHCVGYSVVGYWLDGAAIGNLIGQRGATMEVEVVATFLPRVVVDSLYAVIEQAGLVVRSLTLEPIAAAVLVINPAMRQLNLALVDIGAGTADIALARDGALVAYGMVPVAGDEVTECLCRELLLDYHEGERVKRQLRHGGEITFRDVVGQVWRRPAAELIALIEPVVGQIARQVTELILELNGRPPQAVICIGGGSLTPGLAEQLAAGLDLTPQRVAVRGLEAVPQVAGTIKGIEAAQAVTPVGIAVAAQGNYVLDFAQVLVNRRPVRLLKGGQATVADALLAAGIGLRELYGRVGRGLTVEVNGELRVVKGSWGRPAAVSVNGRPATLETPVGYGDAIEIGTPEHGTAARATVGDVLPPLAPKTITFEGRRVTLRPAITMNGMAVEADTPLIDNAKICYEDYATVESVLRYLGRPLGPEERVTVNGQTVDHLWPVAEGDEIAVVAGGSLGQKREANGLGAKGPPGASTAAVPAIRVTFNGQALTVFPSGSGRLILTDVLRYAEVPTVPPPGKTSLVVEINGAKANFTDPINDGDVIFVGWE
ncbi:MAG: rod shape-determining protein [Clostridia bacterium]|nr:rod shape-determining protein [Clostridia bacterium]